MNPASRIYLDYSATRPVRPEVRSAVEPILFGSPQDGSFGNASSVHWAGQAARRHLESARGTVARILQRSPGEVVFTSGGTEADNLALAGLLRSVRHPRLLLSAVEHPAVLAPAEAWRNSGVDVVLIPPLSSGALDLESLQKALETRTTLVSVMAVNNETGIVHDIPTVRALAAEAGCPLHVDAVQAAGRLPLPSWDADLVALSGHKLGGLPGTGVLAVRASLGLSPTQLGGPQERGHRAGTEFVAGAVSFARALELAEQEREVETRRQAKLRDRLDDALKQLPGCRVLDGTDRVASVTCAVFDAVDGEALLQALDLEGVAVSSGSACSSGSLEPSHVLMAMGLSPEHALSALRFSLGSETEEKDIDVVCRLLPQLLETVRS
ncbi:MAG: cysteine desulfurase family protein [Myxococcota bacterium]